MYQGITFPYILKHFVFTQECSVNLRRMTLDTELYYNCGQTGGNRATI